MFVEQIRISKYVKNHTEQIRLSTLMSRKIENSNIALHSKGVKTGFSSVYRPSIITSV